MGAGAVRVSARELQEEVMAVSEELRQSFIEPPVRDHGRDGNGRNYLLDGASEEVRKYVEQVKADETP